LLFKFDQLFFLIFFRTSLDEVHLKNFPSNSIQSSSDNHQAILLNNLNTKSTSVHNGLDYLCRENAHFSNGQIYNGGAKNCSSTTSHYNYYCKQPVQISQSAQSINHVNFCVDKSLMMPNGNYEAQKINQRFYQVVFHV